MLYFINLIIIRQTIFFCFIPREFWFTLNLKNNPLNSENLYFHIIGQFFIDNSYFLNLMNFFFRINLKLKFLVDYIQLWFFVIFIYRDFLNTNNHFIMLIDAFLKLFLVHDFINIIQLNYTKLINYLFNTNILIVFQTLKNFYQHIYLPSISNLNYRLLPDFHFLLLFHSIKLLNLFFYQNRFLLNINNLKYIRLLPRQLQENYFYLSV